MRMEAGTPESKRWPMTATVVTSTIGRPELRQTIESVRAQTYPARHMVFVNGPRFHAPARAILADFPEVTALYLPEETGDYGYGGNGSMADVFAAAPYLTRADWVFYLDDDNFYEPGHVESVMEMARSHDLAWAYSMRRIVDKDGAYICDDDWCSIGHWIMRGVEDGHHIVDNSCFAVSRRVAQRYALAWTAAPVIADRAFFLALKESGLRCGSTGLATVNYRIGTGSARNDRDAILRNAAKVRADFPGGFPWRLPTVYGEKPPMLIMGG